MKNLISGLAYMPEDKEESTKFVRQRRDLFVISGILLFIQFAGITFKNNIQLGGISVYVKHPEVTITFLWLAWGYWYIRYFQAYKSLNRNLVREKYKGLMQSYLLPIFTEISIEYVQDKIRENIFPQQPNRISYSWTDQELCPWDAKWAYEISDYVNSGKELIERKVFTYGGYRFFKLKLISLIQCTFNHIEFTEYWFPFFFGLLPLIYFLVSYAPQVISTVTNLSI